jgi:hypothetical protein
VDVRFGDAVRLIGVRLPDTPVRAGDSFEVGYTFEALGRLPEGWRIFAHFERPGGGRFQGDHAPPRPFHWWRRGQYIRYDHRVTVPKGTAPGEYTLWMGLFRKAERQPARGDVDIRDDRADLGRVRVTR